MSDIEISYMVAILILMSDENFEKCCSYVLNTDMIPGERNFMKSVIRIAGEKRKIVRVIS